MIVNVAFECYIMRYLFFVSSALADDRDGSTACRHDDGHPHEGSLHGCDNFFHGDGGYPIDAETVILPETTVESFTTPAQEILKPMFDLVWNACGFPGSANFDAEGVWINRTS